MIICNSMKIKSRKLLILTSILSLLLIGCKNPTMETQNTEIIQETEGTKNSFAGNTEIEYMQPAESFAGGKGTKEEPYQIATAEQLALLSEVCTYEKYSELDYEDAKNYIEGYYVLTADIELNDISNVAEWSEKSPKWQWRPIGESHDFKGNFDGNGYTIRGMYISSTLSINGSNNSEPGSKPGLFGEITQAVIENVKLEDSYIAVKGQGIRAGGIVSNAYESDILNCESNVTIEINNSSVDAGGIAGYFLYGNIKKCTFGGKIKFIKNNTIGGIVGNIGNFSEISECKNKGSFAMIKEGELEVTVGGIAGYVSPGEESYIKRCVNEGNIQLERARIGGIAGTIALSEVRDIDLGEETTAAPAHIVIQDCNNKGILSTEGKDCAIGGICAVIHSDSSQVNNEISDMGIKILDCNNEGDVEAVSYGAGIVGQCISASVWGVENCINSGSIRAQDYAGGVIAYANPSDLESQIIKCTNEGSIESQVSTGGILGSFLGFNLYVKEGKAGDVVIDNCLNLGSIATDNSISGTGGIIGSTQSNISALVIQKCRNEGEIRAESSCRIGGILGNSGFSDMQEYKDAIFVISECVNSGTLIQGNGKSAFVTGEKIEQGLSEEEKENYEVGTSTLRLEGGSAIGGIIGYCKQGIIENCINMGNIQFDEDKLVVYTHEDLMSEDDRIFCGGIAGVYIYMESLGNTQENSGIKNCKYSEDMPIPFYVPFEEIGIENVTRQ